MTRRFEGWRAAALLVIATAIALGACSGTAATNIPVRTWPVDSEVLPAATAVLTHEFGPASWALDSSFPAPNATTTELHILVWERACSSGAPATGRMSAPVIEYTATAITITIGVRQRNDASIMTCPGPPGTPASLRLSEPLGQRQLLDGGQDPPVAPSPAFA